MKYYIIAGEASGDLHASNLMAQLKLLDDKADFRFWGGDRMLNQGGVMVKHIRELAYMGFVEVLLNIRAILGNIELCKKDLLAYEPDVLILVDYPGFNLRIAEFAKRHGIRTLYYISPQVWAWKQSRVHKIKRDVDKMLVILPFEKDFYRSYGYDVVFTGHPLLDALAQDQMESTLHPPAENNADSSKKVSERESGLSEGVLPDFFQRNLLPDKPLVALLPGSRKQEIQRMLKVMLSVVPYFPEFHFVVAGVSTFSDAAYGMVATTPNVTVVYDQTYALFKHAEAALVTSGTATLETALFKLPQMVCYKSNPVTFMIAKQLVKLPYISLVNLIMNKEVVKEFIQSQCNTRNLVRELKELLLNVSYRSSMLTNYESLHQKLGGPGASKRAAEEVLAGWG